LVTEYDTTEVPTIAPVIMPGPDTMALALLDVHTPPGAELVSVMPEPKQTAEGPDIVPATGGATIVMIFTADVTPHTFVTVYEIGTVPALTPVTKPTPDTVALALPALHTPPGTDAVRGIEEAIHTLSAPLIVPALGSGLTVRPRVVVAVPHELLTV
jgi:hypothetical protein